MEVTSEHGRRGAEGEFVFGERTGYVDLGLKLQRYTMAGRFVRNSHIGDAGTLIRACESRGPGILVHSTRGPVRVACTNLKVRDNPLEEQGITYFDMEFVKAGDVFGGGAFSLSFNTGGIAFGGLFASLSASFGLNYAPSRSRFYDVLQVTAKAQSALATLKGEFTRAIGANGNNDYWKIVSDFDDAIANTKALKDPKALFANVEAGFQLVDKTAPLADKFESYRRVANAFASMSPLAGAAGHSENAISATVRVMAAAYMAKAANEQPPASVGAALDRLDRVVAVLEGEATVAQQVCDNPLFLAIREFSTTTKVTLLQAAYELPSLVEYKLGRGTHSLVAAHEMFGDARRVREIETRNSQFAPWVGGPNFVGTNG